MYVAQAGGIKKDFFFPLGESTPQIDLDVERGSPGLTLKDFMGDMDIGVVELYTFVVCDCRHGQGDSTPQCPDNHINGADTGIPAGISSGYRKYFFSDFQFRFAVFQTDGG